MVFRKHFSLVVLSLSFATSALSQTVVEPVPDWQATNEGTARALHGYPSTVFTVDGSGLVVAQAPSDFPPELWTGTAGTSLLSEQRATRLLLAQAMNMLAFLAGLCGWRIFSANIHV